MLFTFTPNLEIVWPLFEPIFPLMKLDSGGFEILRCKQRKSKIFSNGILCQIQIEHILK